MPPRTARLQTSRAAITGGPHVHSRTLSAGRSGRYGDVGKAIDGGGSSGPIRQIAGGPSVASRGSINPSDAVEYEEGMDTSRTGGGRTDGCERFRSARLRSRSRRRSSSSSTIRRQKMAPRLLSRATPFASSSETQVSAASLSPPTAAATSSTGHGTAPEINTPYSSDECNRQIMRIHVPCAASEQRARSASRSQSAGYHGM